MNPEQVDTLRSLRAEIDRRLELHRATFSHVYLAGTASSVRRYSDPVQEGYADALAEVLDLLDARIGDVP